MQLWDGRGKNNSRCEPGNSPVAAKGGRLRNLRRACQDGGARHDQAPSRGEPDTTALGRPGGPGRGQLTVPARRQSRLFDLNVAMRLCPLPWSGGGGPHVPGSVPAFSFPPMRKDTLRGQVHFGSVSYCYCNTHCKRGGLKQYKGILSLFWRSEVLNAPEGAKIKVLANRRPAGGRRENLPPCLLQLPGTIHTPWLTATSL